VASGTGPFSYAWRKDGTLLAGRTNSSLILSNVLLGEAGVYAVIVTGQVGQVTNSALLVVLAPTTATPIDDLLLNPGQTAIFTTVASGAGELLYVWRKDAVVIGGQTGSSLVLTNVTQADEGHYTVEVTGACGTVTQGAELRVNLPRINLAPIVTIFSPTNGTVFIAPASFPVLANAVDPDDDGEITKVEFFESGNKIGEVTNVAYYSTNMAVYLLSLTNLPAGTNVFTAVATDNDGATGTSAPVRVDIITLLPISATAVLRDPQHDPHYLQQVTITNPTPGAFDRVRPSVHNLTNVPPITVYNASGTENGVPFVDAQGPIPPGGTLTVTLDYYSPVLARPQPVLQAVLLEGAGPSTAPPAGTPCQINRGRLMPNRNFMVEFVGATNRTYAVLYSSNLFHWEASVPFILGTGTWIQWVDFGQPVTRSAPAAEAARYYRVIEINP